MIDRALMGKGVLVQVEGTQGYGLGLHARRLGKAVLPVRHLVGLPGDRLPGDGGDQPVGRPDRAGRAVGGVPAVSDPGGR
jgi:hypothetical protein